MKKDEFNQNSIKDIWKGRAVCIVVLTVSVFLCILTLLEVTALKMEWDIPVLSALTGGSDSYIFREYRNEEMALDESTENEPLEEVVESTEVTPEAEISGVAENSGQESASFPIENSRIGADWTRIAGEAAAEEEDEFPYYIKINRQQNCITVYTKDENGEYTVPYKAIICSTGLYNATPSGIFHLSDKYRWRELHGGVYGQYASRITGGVLFHSVPYRRKSEDSLYPEKYNKLGQQASMGCVRLTVEDAKWIAENCPSGTTVEVYDDEDPGPLGKPEAMKIDTDNPNKGWDPTDPNEDNPWHELSEDE